MKRYRILPFFDFDARANSLTIETRDEWEDTAKVRHRQNREATIAGLKAEFGEQELDQKIRNFIQLGPKPMSVVAFHNAFFAQVRSSFVIGSYYPALTGACALGERILNHLILGLRDDFRTSAQYKRLHDKESIDDWAFAIDTLVSWEVLLPSVATQYRSLMSKRHGAIHFRPETDRDVKGLALNAIECLQKIIGEQFSAFGEQPWFITDIPGEMYIKASWETKPFIRMVYLQNGPRVGPRHRIESVLPTTRIVDLDYGNAGNEIISDEAFIRLRREFNDGGQQE